MKGTARTSYEWWLLIAVEAIAIAMDACIGQSSMKCSACQQNENNVGKVEQRAKVIHFVRQAQARLCCKVFGCTNLPVCVSHLSCLHAFSVVRFKLASYLAFQHSVYTQRILLSLSLPLSPSLFLLSVFFIFLAANGPHV